MSLHKVRYHHEQFNYKFHPFRGFSVKYWPHDDPKLVNYSVVFCSKKDQFCKRTAREMLEQKPTQVCSVVDFPHRVLVAQRTAWYDPRSRLPLTKSDPRKNAYTWMWKYFL